MSIHERLESAYDALQDAGWMPVGITSTGAKAARQRFQRMDWFATVGPRTVNFYRRGESGPIDLIQAKTSDTNRIRELAISVLS